MSTKLVLEVTAEDIASAKPEPGMCAVEVAAMRQFGASKVGAGRVSLHVYDSRGKATSYRMSENAVEYTRRFDEGKKVEPITIELELTQ